MTISVHVIDHGLGKPAAGVMVTVSEFKGGKFVKRTSDPTDGNGRNDLFNGTVPALYRLRFDVSSYFAKTRRRSLYPYIDVTVDIRNVKEGVHYHFPLLITPHSYTTYRGS